jgi:hypothetical protein
MPLHKVERPTDSLDMVNLGTVSRVMDNPVMADPALAWERVLLVLWLAG